MLQNLMSSILLGLFVLTTIAAYTEINYNLKSGIGTKPSTWTVPAILAAMFWFTLHF